MQCRVSSAEVMQVLVMLRVLMNPVVSTHRSTS